MATDIKLIDGSLGSIRHVKAYGADGQIGILKYEVDGDRGRIGKISVYPGAEGRGVGRRLVSRMFDLHPDIGHWGISAISGRRASLFWFAAAAIFDVTIHSRQYGEISLANSRRHLIQWPDNAWQYWVLPASLNRVRPDPENEKESFAGDQDFPFDGELYGTLLSSRFRSLDGLLTVEAFREAPGSTVLIPQREDTLMENTLSLVDLSLASPPEIEPWDSFEVGNVFDGVHRLSACRDCGSEAVVKSEATVAAAQFLGVEDPSIIHWSTPSDAVKNLDELIEWWQKESHGALRNLNAPHLVRLHDARRQMRIRYGV